MEKCKRCDHYYDPNDIDSEYLFEDKVDRPGISYDDYSHCLCVDCAISAAMNEERGFATRICPGCNKEYDFFEESDELPSVIQADDADLADYGGLCANCILKKFEEEERLYGSDTYDDEDDEEDSGERLSLADAADIWRSHGKDEDYTFGYSEDELENA